MAVLHILNPIFAADGIRVWISLPPAEILSIFFAIHIPLFESFLAQLYFILISFCCVLLNLNGVFFLYTDGLYQF